MLNLIGYMTFNESMVKDSMGRRTQWMVKDSTGDQGLNGWIEIQRMVNQFSGNQEDKDDVSWISKCLFAINLIQNQS